MQFSRQGVKIWQNVKNSGKGLLSLRETGMKKWDSREVLIPSVKNKQTKKHNTVSVAIIVLLYPRNCKINHSYEIYSYKVKA